MNDFKRLHVAAIFVSFLTALRSFLIPLVLSLFLGSSNEPTGFFRFEYIWIGILLFIFLQGIGHWLTFRYRIMAGELYIQRGIFVKKKRYIQQQKVQSIDISAGVFQRLFGLVKLKVETAGGGTEPELHLSAVSREEAEDIRAQLLRKNETSHSVMDESGEMTIEAVEEKADYIWFLSKGHLLIAALTSSGIGLTISAVAALFSQVEQFLPESIYEQLFGFLAESGLALFIGLVVIIIILSWCISFLGTLLKYGGFKIEKHGEEIVITRGLLEQRQLTIHTHRVTAIRVVRNIFRQPFGFATVYVESAGGGTNDEQLSTVLIPLARMKDIRGVFERILPNYAIEYPLQSVPRRALIRFLIRNAITPLVVTVLIGWLINPIAYYGLIIVVICLIFGYLQYRDSGAGCDHTHFWLRYRKVSQVVVISERKKIQAAEIRTSFFQKRKALTSFRFSILSSVVGKSFMVLDLDRDYAMHMLKCFMTSNIKEK
ncbi:PH domain-containing protein [Halalkalibacter alkalisediminis]|uniref:PH domain-containing protein n=1 Tax=Halalkalibacter alkalisediminis TaxID=935616 RepID=A0ABV6NGQ1_9BACI|nr:PH domain-containing protein [Halalkalibacter alkalisediminis]